MELYSPVIESFNLKPSSTWHHFYQKSTHKMKWMQFFLENCVIQLYLRMLYIIGVFYQNVYTSSINRYKSNTKFKKLQKTWGSCEAFLLIKREAGGFRILALRVAKSPSRSTLVIRSDRLKTFFNILYGPSEISKFYTLQEKYNKIIWLSHNWERVLIDMGKDDIE